MLKIAAVLTAFYGAPHAVQSAIRSDVCDRAGLDRYLSLTAADKRTYDKVTAPFYDWDLRSHNAFCKAVRS